MSRAARKARIDFDATYRVRGYSGIAFYALRYHSEPDRFEDGTETGYTVEDPSRVVVVMVGDDRRFEVDADDLSKLSEDEFCPECGQIGCGANG